MQEMTIKENKDVQIRDLCDEQGMGGFGEKQETDTQTEIIENSIFPRAPAESRMRGLLELVGQIARLEGETCSVRHGGICLICMLCEFIFVVSIPACLWGFGWGFFPHSFKT